MSKNQPIIVGSVNDNAGKTSFIIGLAKTIKQPFGYIKPLGDRLIYRKKRLWDYDAALISNIFNLENNSEDMTIGFEHAKLRYMYDEAGTKNKLQEMVRAEQHAGGLLIVEGGKSLTYGSSVRLDTLSLTKHLNGKLVLFVSGGENTTLDELAFIRKYLLMEKIDYGVIINKVNDPEDYRNNYLPDITAMGIKVFGIIPNEPELTHPSMGYLAEKLQARVIAGESGLQNQVKHIFVGSKSADAAMRDPKFNQPQKLIITSGDRSDHIVAALLTEAAGMVLTNNILPPAHLLAKLAETNIPVLLVAHDTYETAKLIEETPPLLTREDTARIELLGQLVARNVDIKSIVP